MPKKVRSRLAFSKKGTRADGRSTGLSRSQESESSNSTIEADTSHSTADCIADISIPGISKRPRVEQPSVEVVRRSGGRGSGIEGRFEDVNPPDDNVERCISGDGNVTTPSVDASSLTHDFAEIEGERDENVPSPAVAADVSIPPLHGATFLDYIPSPPVRDPLLDYRIPVVFGDEDGNVSQISSPRSPITISDVSTNDENVRAAEIDEMLHDFAIHINEQDLQQRDRETADAIAVHASVHNILNRNRRVGAHYLSARNWQNVRPSDLGTMTQTCNYCRAFHFMSERTSTGHYTGCCKKGRVVLPPVPDPPSVLRDLLNGNDLEHGHFMEHILQYNYAFQFASVEANHVPLPGRGPYVYKVQGRIVHHISDIIPDQQNPRYGPIYFLDPDDALARRNSLHRENTLRARILEDIQRVLHDVNPYARGYLHLREVYLHQRREREARHEARIREAEERGAPPPLFEHDPVPNLVLQLGSNSGSHRRGSRPHDLPQVEEVAAVYQEDRLASGELCERVVLRADGRSQLRTIRSTSPMSDPLAFPLLFPHGTWGWHPSIPFSVGPRQPRSNNPRGHISMTDYYRYRLAYRQNSQILHLAGRLGQQYIVNAFVKNEANQLNYIATHQDDFRVETYAGLADYVESNAERRNAHVGRIAILPSSYPNSRRAVTQNYQDSMAIVRHYGPPSFFITFTCNPNWREIRSAIGEGQQPNDHPTIVARVFERKLKELLLELTERQIFGVVEAYSYVIEFQKRGLPHAHIIVVVRSEDKLQTMEQIDQLISAEIPDPDAHSTLYERVCRHMLHRPCGEHNPNAPCMQDRTDCAKRFPQRFQSETTVEPARGVYYRRRNDGRTFPYRLASGDDFEVDNRWIVPYSPYLLMKYDAHINVIGFCNLNVVKYLFKYLNKGYDRALVQITRQPNSAGGNDDDDDGDRAQRTIEYDEVESYRSYKYASPPEAAWRINNFGLRENSHTVYRLLFHLPREQQVRFRENDPRPALERQSRTMFTEWFALNERDPEARRYLYSEIPYFYTYDVSQRRWSRRRRVVTDLITRLYNVSIRQRETYMLRVLLLRVRGPTGYDQLRTVDDRTYDTYEEACRARNLLADDSEWMRCMEEAAFLEVGPQLNRLFAYLLAFCEVHDPPRLWATFREQLLLHYRYVGEWEGEQRVLRAIQQVLLANGTRLAAFGLPEPVTAVVDGDGINFEAINVNAERVEADRARASLNSQQTLVYDEVLRAVHDETTAERLFVIQGAGGTGKTFLYNALIARLRADNVPTVAMAWTGLAATNLKGGRTVHSEMKFPVPWNGTSNLSPNSRQGRRMREIRVIIWDEISMSTRDAFELTDRILRDVCENDLSFGGKVVVLGGDFKQCLPIVTDTYTRANIIDGCVKSSELWRSFRAFELTENVRIAEGEREFAEFLDALGNGRVPTFPHEFLANLIEVPERVLVDDVNGLVTACFGHDVDAAFADSYNKAVLCPLNENCQQINRTIVGRCGGQARTYYSVDTIVVHEGRTADDRVRLHDFDEAYVNTLTPSGMPEHELVLKVGSVVMLLRNLNLREKLCNGTRLVVSSLPTNYLRCERLDHDGRRSGDVVVVPRVDLIYRNDDLPFTLKRRQFPVRLAYAITINKAQGLTLDRVGIYLPRPVFAHGQLYVAFSRARRFEHVSVCVEDSQCHGRIVPHDRAVYTKNIVYREIL